MTLQAQGDTAPDPKSLAAAALRYHSLGLHPIPCEPRGKRALIPWEPYQAKAPEIHDLLDWWTRWPDANVALVMGRGVFVVDCDGPGAETLLRDAGLELPDQAPMVRTGQGYHVYLSADGLIPNRTALVSAPGGKPQVDIKGDRGYVLAPPSIHPSGAIYEWVEPWVDGAPSAPAALVDLIRRTPGATEAANNQPGWVMTALRGVGEGQRNDTCAKLAGYLIGRGVPEAETVELLAVTFGARCRPPLVRAEVASVVASIAQAERRSAGGENNSVFVSAPIPMGAHESHFRILAAPEFLSAGAEEAEQVWLLEEILPGGGRLTLLVGKPKEGKTTFAYDVAGAVAAGSPFLGRKTNRCAVLILALEKHPRDVRARLQALPSVGLERLYVHCGMIDPTPATLDILKRTILEKQIGLVIIDTLAALWRIKDENDAAAVTQAALPILSLARESGAGVLLIHHARKSPGAFGDEIRGSGALFALVDVALILKRNEIPTQRVIHGVSRYPETPAELVIELTDEGYIAIGDPAAATKAARRQRVIEALTETAEEATSIIKKAGVPRRAGYLILADLFRLGEATRAGNGKKGDPFRYSNSIRAGGHSLGENMNTNPGNSDSCEARGGSTKRNLVENEVTLDL